MCASSLSRCSGFVSFSQFVSLINLLRILQLTLACQLPSSYLSACKTNVMCPFVTPPPTPKRTKSPLRCSLLYSWAVSIYQSCWCWEISTAYWDTETYSPHRQLSLHCEIAKYLQPGYWCTTTVLDTPQSSTVIHDTWILSFIVKSAPHQCEM